MYAKKSSQVILFPAARQLENIRNGINGFIYNYGSKGVTINSIIQKFNLESSIVYNIVHSMLNNNIIDKVYASNCPICNNENILRYEHGMVICEHCKECYIPNYTYEKFRSKSYEIAK